MPGYFESMIQHHQSPYGPEAYQQQPVGPFDGLPIPGGVVGQLGFQMLVAPQLEQAMASSGYVPGGMRGHQNLYDRQRAIAKQNYQQSVVNEAAKMEKFHLRDSIGGVNALMGLGLSQQAIESTAGSMAAMAPMLAQFNPQALSDMSSGRGGSPTLMAMRMLETPNRQDAVTGDSRMSAESMSELTRNLYSDMFISGDRYAAKNVSAEDMGGVYAQLARSGMLAPPSGTRRERGMAAYDELVKTAPELARRSLDEAGLTGTKDASDLDIEKLMRTKDLQKVIRQKDSSQIKATLEGYEDMVSAMKDIFGANGDANAPAGKVWAGLEALTGGVQGIKNKGKVADDIRSIGELSQKSGTNIDQLGMLNQKIGQQIAMNNLPAAMQAQLVKSQLSDSVTYNELGMGAAAQMHSLTKSQFLDFKTEMAVRGAKSSFSRNLGAVLDGTDDISDEDASEELKAIREAVKDGKTEYSFKDDKGKEVTTQMLELGSRSKAAEILQRTGGLSSSQASIQLDNDIGINKAIVNHELATKLIPAIQNIEQTKTVEQQQVNRTGTDVARLLGTTVDADKAGAVEAVKQINAIRLDTKKAATPEIQSDPARLRAEQMEALKARIEEAATPEMRRLKASREALSPTDLAASDKELGKILKSMEQVADRTIGEQVKEGVDENTVNQIGSEQSREKKAAVERQAARDAEQRSLAPMTKNLLGNVADALREAKADRQPIYGSDGKLTAATGKFASKLLGGIETGEVSAVVTNALSEINDLKPEESRLIDAEKEIGDKVKAAKNGSEEQTKLKSELKESNKKLAEVQTKIADLERQVNDRVVTGTAVSNRMDPEALSEHLMEAAEGAAAAETYKRGNFDAYTGSSLTGGFIGGASTQAERQKKLLTPEGLKAKASALQAFDSSVNFAEGLARNTDAVAGMDEEQIAALIELRDNQGRLQELADTQASGQVGDLLLGSLGKFDAESKAINPATKKAYASEAERNSSVLAEVESLKASSAAIMKNHGQGFVESVQAHKEQETKYSATDLDLLDRRKKLQDQLDLDMADFGFDRIENKRNEKTDKLEPYGISVGTDGTETRIRLSKDGVASAEALAIRKGLEFDAEKFAELGGAAIKMDETETMVDKSVGLMRKKDEDGKQVPVTKEEVERDTRPILKQRARLRDRLGTNEQKEVASQITEDDFEREYGLIDNAGENVKLTAKQKNDMGIETQEKLNEAGRARRNVKNIAKQFVDNNLTENEKRVSPARTKLATAEAEAAQLLKLIDGVRVGKDLDPTGLKQLSRNVNISPEALKQFDEDMKSTNKIKGVIGRNPRLTIDDNAMMRPGESSAKQTAKQSPEDKSVSATSTPAGPTQLTGRLSLDIPNGIGSFEGSMPNAAIS